MRRVTFVPDGRRIRVTAWEVIEAWRATGTTIPAQYACGTAQHESDYTINEIDVEPSGFTTIGIFQLATSEAAVKLPNADLLTLKDSVAVFVAISERNYDAIARAARLHVCTGDVLAYLHIAHNQGLGACLKSIRRHGLNWTQYKKRNQTMALEAIADAPNLKAVADAEAKMKWWNKVFKYGDNCITGGAQWPMGV